MSCSWPHCRRGRAARGRRGGGVIVHPGDAVHSPRDRRRRRRASSVATGFLWLHGCTALESKGGAWWQAGFPASRWRACPPPLPPADRIAAPDHRPPQSQRWRTARRCGLQRSRQVLRGFKASDAGQHREEIAYTPLAQRRKGLVHRADVGACSWEGSPGADTEPPPQPAAAREGVAAQTHSAAQGGVSEVEVQSVERRLQLRQHTALLKVSAAGLGQLPLAAPPGPNGSGAARAAASALFPPVSRCSPQLALLKLRDAERSCWQTWQERLPPDAFPGALSVIAATALRPGRS